MERLLAENWSFWSYFRLWSENIILLPAKNFRTNHPKFLACIRPGKRLQSPKKRNFDQSPNCFRSNTDEQKKKKVVQQSGLVFKLYWFKLIFWKQTVVNKTAKQEKGVVVQKTDWKSQILIWKNCSDQTDAGNHIFFFFFHKTKQLLGDFAETKNDLPGSSFFLIFKTKNSSTILLTPTDIMNPIRSAGFFLV